MKTRVHLLAVIVAALANFVLGAVWYTTFSEQWLSGIGKTKEQLTAAVKVPAVPYAVSIICSFLIAYCLSVVLIKANRQTLLGGITFGLLIGIGFVATNVLTQYMFEGRDMQLFAINAGYMLLGMVIMGAIVGAWKEKQAAAVPEQQSQKATA